MSQYTPTDHGNGEQFPHQGQPNASGGFENEDGKTTDFSYSTVARTKDEMERMESELRRKRWKETPYKQFAVEVGLPSVAVGGLSLVFASYAGPVEWWQPAVTAAATWPTLRLAGMFGKAVGKPLGHLQNYINKQSFMHTWVPGQVSAWMRGAALVTLLHGGHSLPIYANMVSDASQAVYNGVTKTASCVWNGFNQCFNTSSAPLDSKQAMAARAHDVARAAIVADNARRQAPRHGIG